MDAEAGPETPPAEEAPDTSRRCKVLWLSGDLLIGVIATGHWFRLTAELPKDTEVVALAPDFERQAIGVLIRHPSFPETELGEQYPSAGVIEVAKLGRVRGNDTQCDYQSCEHPAEVGPVWGDNYYCSTHYNLLRRHQDPPAAQLLEA